MTGQHCERLSTLVGFWHVDISLLLLSTSHRLPMLKKCPFNTEDQLFVQYKRTAALTHTIPLLTLLEQRSWTLQCQSYHQSPNPNRTTEADNSIDLTWLAPWGQAGKLMGHPPSFYSFHSFIRVHSATYGHCQDTEEAGEVTLRRQHWPLQRTLA